MRAFRNCAILTLSALLMVGSSAQAVQFFTLNFEGLTELSEVANQYAAQHATFSGATILTAGSSLNEIDFPPHSGTNVAHDFGTPVRIDFGLTAYDWSAYFTYNSAVTIKAWDESNNLLGIVNSSFSDNYVSTGNPPNELLSFASATGFRAITIEGSSGAGSVVFDDVSYTVADEPNPVPEPGTLVLFAGGLGLSGLAAARRRLFPRR